LICKMLFVPIDPDSSINIAVGPVAVHSASMEPEGSQPCERSTPVRDTPFVRKRAQASAGETTFHLNPLSSTCAKVADLPGTSCAHCMVDGRGGICMQNGAVCVQPALEFEIGIWDHSLLVRWMRHRQGL
jgi:hypothetical protein